MGTEPQHVGLGQGFLAEVPKAVALIAATVLAALWRWLLRRRRRAAALAELLEAREERDRVAADAIRFSFSRYDEGLTADEQAARIAVYRHDLDKARKRVWLAEGRPDPETQPDEAELERRILREIRRTKDRIQPIDDTQQDIFRREDLDR